MTVLYACLIPFWQLVPNRLAVQNVLASSASKARAGAAPKHPTGRPAVSRGTSAATVQATAAAAAAAATTTTPTTTTTAAAICRF